MGLAQGGELAAGDAEDVTWRAVLIDAEEGRVRPITGPGIQGARLLDFARGYLFWVDPASTLLVAPLDLETASLDRAPVALATEIQSTVNVAGAHFAVSEDGTVLFYSGGASGGLGENLGWVDRQGRTEIIEERLAEEAGDFDDLALGPDGRFVAVQTQPSNDDESSAQVWIFDLDQEAFYPLTFDGVNYDPEWLPGGRVAYVTEGEAVWEVRAQPFDRSGPEEVLLELDRPIEDLEVPPGGEPLVVVLARDPADPSSTASVYLADPGEASSLRPFVDSRFDEREPEVSPDGRWLAYVSVESGRREVVVRAFPQGGRPWPVSREGGSTPIWSPEGDELVYATPGGQLRSARLDLASGVTVTSLTDLFSNTPFELTGYELAPGAERFLMIVEASGGAVGEPVMLFNVFPEIERRLEGG